MWKDKFLLIFRDRKKIQNILNLLLTSFPVHKLSKLSKMWKSFTQVYNDIKTTLLCSSYIKKWNIHTFLVLMHTLTFLFFSLNPSSNSLDLFFLLVKMRSVPKNIKMHLFHFSLTNTENQNRKNNKSNCNIFMHDPKTWNS